jgi:ribosomal protein S18 acetylase RimI-like enzyme
MPDVTVLPLSHAEQELVAALMQDEEHAWMADLSWDYSPIRQILLSFLAQNLLPGYIALAGRHPVSYSYFLVHRNKGIIGTLYSSNPDCHQDIAYDVLAHAIEALKDSTGVRRIEAQIMPFHGVNLTPEFTRHGFRHYTRYFMKLAIGVSTRQPSKASPVMVVPWEPSFLRAAADIASRSYLHETDALICEDYRSSGGCESYLRSLVDNPGCGVFMPEASFVALDRGGSPCGFIMSSRISQGAGMIPQIAILPDHQGQGIGSTLMQRALTLFSGLGFHSVSLTVTKNNRKAFQWYQRVGFSVRKEFGAYVWERR